MKQTFRKLLIMAMALVVISTSEAFVAMGKPVDDPAAPGRRSVGLVLSGGGAKGAAQLRIIKAIEEAGIPIDYIAGTSIGSIIGGLYSVGYTVEEIENYFTSMNWFNIFTDRNERSKRLLKDKHKDDAYMFDALLSTDDISLPSGIVRGDKFMDELNELLLGFQQIDSFDNLPIPFACVSYDMNTGSEYVARGGSLPMAIRASMSIPGVFKPVRYKDMLLVDGGVYNNFPVDVVRDMGADIVIGVDLADGLRTDDDLENMVLIFEQLTTFLGREKYEANLASCDYYMRPEVAPYTAASFNAEAVDSLIMRGQREADAHRIGLQELRKKIGLPKEYKAPVRPKHYSSDTKLYIGPITFRGFNKTERALINRHLGLRPYSTVTRKEFNQHIEDVRNVGGFDFVRYSLNNRAPYELIIGVNEKENTSVHVGFRFDTQELASLLLGTEMTMHGNYFKPKFSLTTRLSQSPYVELSASSSRVFFGDFTLAYKYQYHDFTFYKNEARQNSANFNEHNLSILFSDIYLQNFNMNVGVEYEFFDFHQSLYYSPLGTLTEAKPEGYINYKFNGHYESLDDFYMPHKGWSVEADYTIHTTNGLEVQGHSPFTSLQYKVMSALTPLDGPITFIGSLYGRTLIGPKPTYPYQNCMGGILPGRYMSQQMPFIGIQHVELFDNSVMVGTVEARYEFYKNHTLSAIANGALQNDNFWQMFNFKQRLLGFGVKYTYHTSLGPLTVLASGTNLTPLGGIYVSFGKNF